MVISLIIMGVVLLVGSTVFTVSTDFDLVWPIVFGFVLGFSALVWAVILNQQHEADTCHRNGGYIRKTGKVYTTYVYVNRVLLPIQTDETECYIP